MSAYHVSPCLYLVDGCLSARRPGLFDFNRWFGVRSYADRCRSSNQRFCLSAVEIAVRVKIGMSFQSSFRASRGFQLANVKSSACPNS